MSWYKPADVGFSARRQLADLGHGARLFFRLLSTLGGSLKRFGLIRDQIDQLWAPFIGDLKQYMQAFREDIWQPRQSGLCNGWCPVTDCEFWKPKRNR